MPRGASSKREREFNELKSEFKKEGRYKGREEEVAARIVNKQRARYRETKPEKAEDQKGRSPDRSLPISNYEHQTIPQIAKALSSLSRREIQAIKSYEQSHKQRKTLLDKLDRAIDRE